MSGAGKTVAIQSFEDIGYFTIDNMPPSLVPKVIELVKHSEETDKIALVIDMRSRLFFDEINDILDKASVKNRWFRRDHILRLIQNCRMDHQFIIAEWRSTSYRSKSRHQDIIDQGGDDLAERATNDNADCHVDDISL